MVVIIGKRCSIDGCENLRSPMDKAIAVDMLERTSLASRTRSAALKTVKTWRWYATEREIVTRCGFEGCQNLHRGQGYCEDHQSHEVKPT